MRDIYLYGLIGGGDWFSEGTTASDLVRQLRDCGGEDVTLHINSEGGDAFEAVAMTAAIRGHQGTVRAVVEGLAASAASVVMTAAQECSIVEGSMVMVHDPWSSVQGGASEMRSAADLLDKVRDSIADAYARKTGMGRDECAALMAEETWMSAEEAVAMGFCDRVDASVTAVAMASRGAMARYRRCPAGVVEGEPKAPDGPCESGAKIPAADSAGGTGAEAAPVPAESAGVVVLGGSVYIV